MRIHQKARVAAHRSTSSVLTIGDGAAQRVGGLEGSAHDNWYRFYIPPFVAFHRYHHEIVTPDSARGRPRK
jgi:hypothetical protein